MIKPLLSSGHHDDPGSSLRIPPWRFWPSNGWFQAKLAVGRSDDPLEQEADRVADAVLSMPEPSRAASDPGDSTARLPAAPASAALQRKCNACAEEEEDSTPLVQRSAAPGSAPRAHEAPAIVAETLSSTGRPLDAETRAFMQPRLGHDLDGVRIHTDARAAESANAVAARAYTVGPHIVFSAGSYAPETTAGRHLLAHELAHVVQQHRGSGSSASLGPVVQRQPAGPSNTKSVGEARLNRLATYPGEALTAWKGLSQGDRDAVGWKMASRYGWGFYVDFLSYAKGVKKPRNDGTIAQSHDITPKWLMERGYAHAGTPGGTSTWVHPSGHVYWLLSPPAKPATPTPAQPPATAQPPSAAPDPDLPNMQDPCTSKCTNQPDEAACDKCCDDTIPATDQACRTKCHDGCFFAVF